MKTARGAGPRRVPLQDRSRQRVERILDAAARVFDEVGYEVATTEAIAARAKTSIGSLYQFFPNKLALFNALGARYLDRVRALFDRLMAPPALELPWPEFLDGVIDAFAAFHRDEPGFRALLPTARLSGDFMAADEALVRELARRIEQLMASRAPALDPSRHALVATIIVEVVSAMLVLSARREPPFRDLVIEETKAMLRRYLAPYLGPA